MYCGYQLTVQLISEVSPACICTDCGITTEPPSSSDWWGKVAAGVRWEAKAESRVMAPTQSGPDPVHVLDGEAMSGGECLPPRPRTCICTDCGTAPEPP